MTIAPAPRATVPFWDRLDASGDAAALVAPERTVSYAELAERVRDLADRLGPTRRLVALETRNDVDTVVGLLACLAGRHPVLPLDPSRPSAELLATYDPDVVLGAGDLTERRPGTAHDLHPDLALLLSTSGSTGSPKLVRLSQENLTSNAAAIGASLGIRRHGPRRDHAAAALLLRAVGADQPPGGRRSGAAHRALRRRPVLLGAGPS